MRNASIIVIYKHHPQIYTSFSELSAAQHVESFMCNVNRKESFENVFCVTSIDLLSMCMPGTLKLVFKWPAHSNLHKSRPPTVQLQTAYKLREKT